MVLPVYSYGLKSIEVLAGFARTQEEFGGSWSIARYIRATESRDEHLRDSIMDEILKYNEEDLKGMWAVYLWVKGLGRPSPQGGTEINSNRQREESMGMQLLRATEVMQVCNISRTAAYELMRHPRMRTVRLGRSVRVDIDDLRRFIEEQKAGGEPAPMIRLAK